MSKIRVHNMSGLHLVANWNVHMDVVSYFLSRICNRASLAIMLWTATFIVFSIWLVTFPCDFMILRVCICVVLLLVVLYKLCNAYHGKLSTSYFVIGISLQWKFTSNTLVKSSSAWRRTLNKTKQPNTHTSRWEI